MFWVDCCGFCFIVVANLFLLVGLVCVVFAFCLLTYVIVFVYSLEFVCRFGIGVCWVRVIQLLVWDGFGFNTWCFDVCFVLVWCVCLLGLVV